MRLMRVVFGAAIVFALIAACTPFAGDSTPATSTDAGADGGDTSPRGDAAPAKCTHTFCATFDDGLTKGWDTTTPSADNLPRVDLAAVSEAARAGAAGLRVTVAPTSAVIFRHLDRALTGLGTQGGMSYAFSFRVDAPISGSGTIEIAAIQVGAGAGNTGTQIIFEYSAGQIFLVREENSTSNGMSAHVPVTPNAWYSIEIIANFGGSAFMQLVVDGTPTASVPLGTTHAYDGNVNITMGVGWVDGTLGAQTMFDIDELTFDAK